MERSGRQPRIHEPNTIHHVMMRGNNRQRIFYGDNYFDHFIEIVSDSVSNSIKKFDHKILAYCLMTNHIHLIVQIHESPLSNVMQYINFRYARWANKKLEHIGHMFQARYHSIRVHNEEYLVNLCRYIHFNPVAASMAKTPNDYPWSSHKNYLTQNAPEWLDLNIVTHTINHKTQLNYDDFIKNDVDREKWKPAFYFSESGEFIIDDIIMNNANAEKTVTEIKKKNLSAEEVSSVFSECITVNLTELFGSSKNIELSKKRALLISYLLKFTDLSLSKIANLFQRTPPTLRRQVMELMQSNNKYFSDEVLQKMDFEMQKKAIDLKETFH